MGSVGGSDPGSGGTETSLTDVVTEFPTIVSQDITKRYIKLVGGIFVAIGAGLAIPYVLFSITGLTDSVTGGGDFFGGAAMLSLFGIVPLFGSLIVAVVMGIFVGTQLDDERYAIVAAGVGSYLGFIGMILALVISVQFVDSGMISSVIGLEIGSLLQELLVAGTGVGVAGAGAGYVGHRMTETIVDPQQDVVAGSEDVSLLTAVREIPASIKEDRPKAGIKLIVSAFAVMGVGYGVMVIALGWIAGETIAVTLSLIASYSVVFSAPFLAVYLGVKVGETSSTAHGVAAGSVGALFGFTALIVVMTVLGSFGPDPSILEGVESTGQAVSGTGQGSATGFIPGLLGLLPYGYEVSRILVFGGIGTAIAGGLAAFTADGSQRGVEA